MSIRIANEVRLGMQKCNLGAVNSYWGKHMKLNFRSPWRWQRTSLFQSLIGIMVTSISMSASAWQLTFSDDFNSLSLYNVQSPNGGNWAPTSVGGHDYYLGGAEWKNQGNIGWADEFDVNPFTNTLGFNPFSVANGILTIT